MCTIFSPGENTILVGIIPPGFPEFALDKVLTVQEVLPVPKKCICGRMSCNGSETDRCMTLEEQNGHPQRLRLSIPEESFEVSGAWSGKNFEPV
ncbi:MAG: hypothetical protein K9M10_04000 [Candidatus Pacebacteria bacterium]|nr:hypothetical protein [Candidatus Paceibacterota bacterium]MCF7857611.1 hypothetical protein [Candidatus Paceibacterota bacterium]